MFKTTRHIGTRGVLVGVSTAAIALGTAAVATASGGHPPTPATSHAGRVLHFGVRFSPFHVIDVPPLQKRRGDYQPGDYTVFSDVLTNGAGKAVGTEGGSGLITRVSAKGAQIFFSLAIKLPQGQLAAQGLATTAPSKQLAVVGGTGHFTGARGHLKLLEHGDGTGTLTVTLR
jgi:hypothetical protein